MPALRRFIFFAALLLVAALPARAQEFNCTVNVDIRQVTGSEYTFLSELKDRIEEYVNQRAWTEHTYQEEERIECSIQISVEQALSLTRFKARMVVATRRPIYGTTQNTTVVQISDNDWIFDYAQGTPITFQLEQYDNLASVLNFYVYVMLGYDYDTFGELGGTPYFETARRIVERAQTAPEPGWTTIGTDQSRAALITQLLDPRFSKLRLAYYNYFLNGLDRFVRQTEPARRTMLTVVQDLSQLRDEVARSYAQDLFFSSKYQELTAVFEKSPVSSQAYQLLSRVDPAHLSEYNKLVQ